MEEKIKKATEYVRKERIDYETRNRLAEISDGDDLSIKNDAANIFGSSFDEYMAIWDALEDV